MLLYELKKVFLKRINRIILLIIAILTITFSFFAINSAKYVDFNGKEYNSIFAGRKLSESKSEYEGKLTNNKIKDIYKNNYNLHIKYGENIPNNIYAKYVQPSTDIEEFMINVASGINDYNPDYIVKENIFKDGDFYKYYGEKTLEYTNEYGNSPYKFKFLKEKYENRNYPLYYEPAISWNTISLYWTTFSIILVILISILVSSIFSDEYSYKTDSIFFTTKFGKSRATFNKIITGFIVSTIIYFVSVIFMILIILLFMGLKGFTTPYSIEQPFSIYYITAGGQSLIIILSGFIACMLSASITMLVSSRTSSIPLSISLPVLLFAVSPFIGRVLPFKKIFELTPDQLINLYNNFRIPNIYQLGTFVFRQIPALIIIYFVASLLLIPFIYKSYKYIN